jgi:hypothetical protein
MKCKILAEEYLSCELAEWRGVGCWWARVRFWLPGEWEVERLVAGCWMGSWCEGTGVE